MRLNDGERLKLVRKAAGDLSQQKFANLLGIPIHKIRDTEAGKIKISIETAIIIEEKFDYDFKWLLTGKGTPHFNGTTIEEQKNLDSELLQTIIISIEEGLQERGLHLPPEKKAELITLLYDHFAGADKEVDQNTVRRYLRLVA